jgi:hypothetical protein
VIAGNKQEGPARASRALGNIAARLRERRVEGRTMTTNVHRRLLWTWAASVAAIAMSCSSDGPDTTSAPAAVSNDQPPTVKGEPPLDPPPQDPGPPLAPGPVRQPPKMEGTAASVEAFIAWAAASTGPERELGRAAILDAAADPRNIALLGEQLMSGYQADVGRALVMLAILGEMRTPDAEKRLGAFIRLKAQPSGQVIDGEDSAVAGLGLLQAKAVDGLAYQGTQSADKQVLTIAVQHPDVAVRSEAMVAYLWNHGNTEAARKVLLAAVRPDEVRYVDRVLKLPTDDAATFDQKLARYLGDHPEVIPPAPQAAQSGAKP